jgi:hypothetical protein
VMRSLGGTHVGEFWRSRDGRVVIWRHCDAVFELLCEGVRVMPVCRFESVCAYVWAEFPPEGFQ